MRAAPFGRLSSCKNFAQYVHMICPQNMPSMSKPAFAKTIPITFARMVDEVRACTLCSAHLPLGPRPIFQLNPAATILIAGQAPGKKAHESGIPFNDPSGDRLRNWMGIDRDTFYDDQRIAILPMGLCFPGTAAGGDLPPRPECAAQWRQRLLDSLPNIRLTLVIGSYAMHWHAQASKNLSVTDIVKEWQTHWPAMLPLPHPSPRNQRWLRNNPWFEHEVIPVLRGGVAQLID
jgi:uracil-DNA glycosylase